MGTLPARRVLEVLKVNHDVLRPMSMARVAVLNLMPSLVVEIDGEPLPVKQNMARLLALLAIERRPLERAYVAGRLGKGVDEKRAHANLRTTLWRIGEIAEGLIMNERRQLSLAPEVKVDLTERWVLARRAIDLDYDVDLEESGSVMWLVEQLSTDVLLGWYDDWLQVAQARWRQLRMNALETLSDHLRVRGRYQEAVHAALVAAAVEPLRETPQRCIIRAHLAEGNAVEALRVYADYSKRLREEMGIVPSPILTELLSVLRPSSRLQGS